MPSLEPSAATPPRTMTITLKLSPRESDALLHALRQWHDKPSLLGFLEPLHSRHRAAERAAAILREVALAPRRPWRLVLDDLDRALMIAAIERSDWPALHAASTPQMQTAVYEAMNRAASKVESAFALTRALVVPIA